MFIRPVAASLVALFTLHGAAVQAQTQPQTKPQAQTPADLACLARLRPAAPANGVSFANFDRYTQGAVVLASTVAAAKAQPEGNETWWDYIAKTVDQQRIDDGRAVLAQWQPRLNAIDSNYQIDGETLVAIFGIETNYGALLGKTRVVDAWVTRACTERNPLWTKNAYAALRLLSDGTVSPDTFVGSWSGAFGMTQFIPTSFYELAADGDGDGRIDLYRSIPDALASTANHLRKRQAKWLRGVPAVIEVRLPPAVAATVPAGADAEYSGSQNKHTLAQWAMLGVKPVAGGALDRDANGASRGALTGYLFAPTGSGGPIFIATQNFDAIRQYNRSYKYTLAVSLLINGLKGEAPVRTAWPTNDPGLSRAEIKELQTRLVALGYDIGVPDGIPGGKTRDAVGQEQQKRGLVKDGRIGRHILDTLRASR
jgi:lytic murein transglycosylase